MGVILDLPAPPTCRLTSSMKIMAKSTGLSPLIAPRMVFPIVRVTRVGLSGCTIGTKNSKSLRSLGSLHSLTGKPSLGSASLRNLPLIYWSVRLAMPPLPGWKSYTSLQTPVVHSSGQSRMVVSKMLLCSNLCSRIITNCWMNSSFLRFHGRSNSPTHPMFWRSLFSMALSPSSPGITGITFLRDTCTPLCLGAISLTRCKNSEND